jgi:HTH-type transcriptional regulator/antitoxin HigA
MTLAATHKKLPASYYTLIGEFPLTRIRDDAHLAVALDVIDNLLKKKLDVGGQEYLDVLTDLVEAYEDESVDFAAVSDGEVLAELMSQHGLTQKSLSDKIGISQSTISDVLRGKRSLTKKQVLALSGHFNVKPTLFLSLG